MIKHYSELKLVAWEITRSCNLFCAHCRSGSASSPYQDELSTEECLRLIDDILKVGKPVLILSGGEPLLRHDLFQISKYATSKGLRVVLGTNGTLITQKTATRLKEIRVSRIGVSLDFPIAELEDNFRGEKGAFEAAIAGIKAVRQAGIEVQINSTITKLNAPYLDSLLRLALELGAVAFHPFMLVPVGRGKGLQSVELTAEESEQILNWIYDKQIELKGEMSFKPTCAPHYGRVAKQRGIANTPQPRPFIGGKETASIHNVSPFTRGCLAGISFCFISHQGKVQGCGYLEVKAGNSREEDFSQIWTNSPLFLQLRNLSNIKGKCGACEYKMVCGGCRARAFEVTGDYLGAEPYCIYRPGSLSKANRE